MRRRTDYSRLEGRLGYRFNNRSHLIHALTPSSKQGSRFQVLEFDGDGALRYVLPKLLVERYPDQASTPGELSRMYSTLSCNESLAHLALRLKVIDYVRGGDSSSIRALKPLADVVEAIVGAVDADGGIESVIKVCRKLFRLDLELVRFDRAADILTRLAAHSRLEKLNYRIIPKGDNGRALGHVCILQIGQDQRSEAGSGFTAEWAMKTAAAIALLTLYPERFSTSVTRLRWDFKSTRLVPVERIQNGHSE